MFLKLMFSPVTKKIVERRVLETHPMHLFRIIQDVDSYSSFLPMCWNSKVLKVYDGGREFDATLTVGMPGGVAFKGLTEQYTSRVLVCPETMTIESRSTHSKLFDSLRSTWKLNAAHDEDRDSVATSPPPKCNVEFEVEVTVSDPVVASILDSVLQEVAVRQMEAFDKRCQAMSWPSDLQHDINRQ
jgi:ribosome-associated toxin RatA of RatAB toxin-antitoxin module